MTMPGARVTVVCGIERRETLTGRDGEFTEGALPAGRCDVTVSAEQFQTATRLVPIADGATVSVTITLAVRRFAFATDVVVTPGKGSREQTSDVPESVSSTSRDAIRSRPYQLLPQVLGEEPGVMLQQTTSGQTSPVIRGFTGQSNVYLVNGVRLNTSAWRSGPSQYTAWLNAAAFDRVEVVRGPGSVQSGSDAMGGTVQFLADAPSPLASGIRVGGTVDVQLGSADRSGAADVELTVQSKPAAFRVGLGSRRLEDLRPGLSVDSHAAVTTFLGLPSSVVGERLTGTGFSQSGAYALGNIRAGRDASLSVTYLHSTQTGVNRYDRILGGTGLYSSGFRPQAFDFGSVRYERARLAWFDTVSGTFSVNRQADGRFEQARPTARLDRQEGTTTAFGYQGQGVRRFGGRQQHGLTIGAEFFDETTRAFRVLEDPLAMSATAARPDIPDRTGYSTLGLFVQDSSELIPGRLYFRGGLRYGRFAFTSVSDPVFGVIDEHVVSGALTFQAGTVVPLWNGWQAAFNVSRGFRAANAADLGGIGLSGGGGFEISPSTAAGLGGIRGTTTGTNAVSSGEPIQPLGPEVVWAFEPALRFRSGRVSASVNAFDLELGQTIQRRAVVFPASIVGMTIAGYEVVRQDANGLAYVAQDPRPIATRVNLDRARVLGFDAEGRVQLARHWLLSAAFSMSNGRVLGGDYLRRMPPPLGTLRLRWTGTGGSRWVEGVLSFADRQTRLSDGDLSDARIGAPRSRSTIAAFFNGTATDMGLVRNGVLLSTGETLAQVQTRVLGTATSGTLYTSTPGFAVVGLRAGWVVNRVVDLTLIGENLTDRNYRIHGSGVDGAGINVQLRARCRF